MSSSKPSEDDVPASLDDPDWVDRIVAKAMESAERAGTDPGPETEPPAETVRPASTPAAPPARGPATQVPAASRPPADAAAPPRPSHRPAQPTDPADEPVAADPGPTPNRDAVVEPAAVPAPVDVETIGGQPGVGSSVFDQDSAPAPLPIEDDETTDQKPSPRSRALVEWIAVIAGAIIVAFLVKTFLVQAFYIPSSSMEPTLQINDRVLVNKLSYDVGDVGRGDLVVFERPENLVTDTDDLIKRVIGLPGETIDLIDGRVYIDGRGLNEPYVGDLPTDWLGFDETARELCGGDDVCTIPEGYVFVMGDNRTGSTDSRRFGPIPEDDIVGRAFLRIWPLNDIGWL